MVDPRTAAAGGALGMLWPPAAGRAPAQDVTGDPQTVVSRTKHAFFLWLKGGSLLSEMLERGKEGEDSHQHAARHTAPNIQSHAAA